MHPSTYACRQGINPDTGQPYRFTGFEFLETIINDLHPRLVLQKSAQVGATVLAMLRTLYFLDERQQSCMYLFPTHRTAERFRRGRFAVMVQRNPDLKGRLKPTGAPGHMALDAAQFYCHGARSRAELMSVPISYLTLDERDELYRMAGMEGTPWSAVDLARQRLAGQPESWELSLSTPTLPGYGIAKEFSRSDQREFILRCPHCGKHSPATWPAAILGLDGVPAQAQWCCPLCRHPWTPDERAAAIAAGTWVAQVPGNENHGYHISRLLSPVAKPALLVRDWQDAQGDPAALQIFHNAVLGLPYLTEGARLEPQFIDDAIARSNGAEMSARAYFSVAGVDVGPSLLHIVIADPIHDALRILWAGVVCKWEELDELFQRYGIRSYVIDAQPEVHSARDRINRFPGGWLCYYNTSPNANHQFKPHLHRITASRSESLDALYFLWRNGKIIAPVNLPIDFVSHLRSLMRVIRLGRFNQPRAEYLEAGGPDHYAHAMNYCYLAMQLLPQPTVFRVIQPEGR